MGRVTIDAGGNDLRINRDETLNRRNVWAERIPIGYDRVNLRCLHDERKMLKLQIRGTKNNAASTPIELDKRHRR